MTDERDNGIDAAEAERVVARRSIWRGRGRRFATGLHVFVSLALAALLVLLANLLAQRHYARWNWSRRDDYKLSPKTQQVIAALAEDVSVVAFFQKNHELFDEVRALLKEYGYEAGRHRPARLSIELVDPDRDLARTREMKRTYELNDANVVVFHCQGRRKYVDAKALAEYAAVIEGGRPVKKRTAFLGEQAFTSALQSVMQARRPMVYFLRGHGERDTSDFGEHAGYSDIARIMRRDNVVIAPLQLSQRDGVPADCSAIVIAGADRRLSQPEVDMLSEYLDRSGRLLLLVDPATMTGLEPLLRRWGVRLERDVVVGLTLTGPELVVTGYGDHEITRSLRKVTTMFYQPRSVEPAEPAAPGAVSDDRPRVTVLAACTRDGWAETDLAQSPPRYDEGVDRPGPVSVAVAVERGAVSGIEVAVRPTRIVVIGDSYFVSNAALKSGMGGNTDFFLSALNWLVEREALIAIGPRTPGELRLEMNRSQLIAAYAAMVAAVPAVVALLGVIVAAVRRH